MSLYLRGRIWWYEFKVNGRKIRQSTGETQKRKAQQVERVARQKISDDLHQQRIGQPLNRTYGDALLRWLETAPPSMLSHARNTRPYLDDIVLPYVPSAAHDMKSDMLKRGLSPQTINRRLAIVKRVLNVAYKEWDWLSHPVADKIRLLSEKGLSRDIFLSKKEVTDLVEAMENETAKRITLLAAYTGLRKSEILRLTPDNWKPPYINLTSETKSGKPRSVPVIAELHEYVVLPFKITNWELRKSFETARDVIERPDIRFHDLRHTFASWLVEDPNIPLTVIRDLLGHSSLAVTSKYSHLRGTNLTLVQGALSKKSTQ